MTTDTVKTKKPRELPHGAPDTVASAAARGISPATLTALALLTTIAPFGTDMYLSAFPQMTADLATTPTGVQLSLTAFLVGAGLGQVIFGPWSDRVGRMRPLLAGLVLFIAASVVTVLAGSVEVLVIARLVQGIGGAAGMVLGRAIIIDREEGPAAARALSLMMMIGGVAPVVAPLAGSLLSTSMGWRGLLAIVGALGVLSLVVTLLFVRESLPPDVRAARKQARQGGGLRVLLSRGYVGNVVAYGFSMAIMMAYISASPFVYQSMIGLDAVGYGIAFAVNAVGLVVAGSLSVKLVRAFRERTLATAGIGISLAASALVAVLAMAGAPAGWLMIPMFFAISPLGLVLGNTTALALSAVPHTATGVASAVLGLLQFLLAGVVAALVGVAGENTAVPLAIVMVISAVIALLGVAVGSSGRTAHPNAGATGGSASVAAASTTT